MTIRALLLSGAAALALAACATAGVSQDISYYCPAMNASMVGSPASLEAQIVFVRTPGDVGRRTAARIVWFGEDCSDNNYYCTRFRSPQYPARAFSIVVPRVVTPNTEFEFSTVTGVVRYVVGINGSRHSLSIVTWEREADGVKKRVSLTVRNGLGVTSISGVPLSNDQDEQTTCTLDSARGFFTGLRAVGLQRADGGIL
jgi:hypothetical protein